MPDTDGLVYRKRMSTTVKKELLELLNELSKETRIDKSKLCDEAIEDLLKKHNKIKSNGQ